MVDFATKPTGSDVETAQPLAKDWGLELEFVHRTARRASRMSRRQGRYHHFDALSHAGTRQGDRLHEALCGFAIGSRPPKSLPVKDRADLKGTPIAVSRGTTQDTTLTNMKERALKIARYYDDATMVTAAVSGQNDCVASSATIVNQIGVKNPARLFDESYDHQFRSRHRRPEGEPRLVEKLNEWITNNLKNGKLNEIYKKFHGFGAAGKPCAADEPR